MLGHMRRLGGEFVCVPFGVGGTPQGLLPGWDAAAWAHVNPVQHGPSADADWKCVSHDSSQIQLRLSYPIAHDVDYLTRSIRVVPDAAALEFELTIHARRPTRQPVGLHPILRLPEPPGTLRIDAKFDFGHTYPGVVPPGVSQVAPGRRFTRLDAIPALDGGIVDYSTLPKSIPTEDMIQLCNVRGPLEVLYGAERVRLRLSWDTHILPSCLIWPSDRAIAEPPWNRAFRGLGIEPIAAMFDASREASIQANPLSDRGVATFVALEPDKPLTIRYRVECLSDLE
jgi:hypothetical protein